MAEQAEEITKLLEELKRESELNNEDYTKILTEIKNKLDNLSDNREELDVAVNKVKDVLDSKMIINESQIKTLDDTLADLRSAIYASTDYSELQEQVKALTENFKSGFNSVISFANKDADAKNLLLDRMDTLEKAVRNGEVIESLRHRTDELVKGYEDFISDSNLRHGNMVSALVDLKNKIDDYSSKNNYVFGSMNHALEETSDKISGLESTVSSNLGNVTSKLYSISDEVQKILNDGFDNLKYLSSNVSEAMNSSSLDVKTTLEALRATISDYSTYLKEEFQNLNDELTTKIKNGDESQIVVSNDIINKIHGLEILFTEKHQMYKDFVSEKINQSTELTSALKDLLISTKSENDANLDDNFTGINTKFGEINSKFEKLMVSTSEELQEISANISKTSENIIQKISETDDIQNIKEELLASSSSNLNSILEKIDNLATSVDSFQNTVADNFSNYISEMKTSLEDFSQNAIKQENNDEIADKILNIEFLMKKFAIEKDENFEKLKELIENGTNAANSLKEISQNNFDNLREIINGNSLSKDEKLDLIKELVENNKLTLDDIKSSINSAEALENLNNLINEKSTSKDEKLDLIKELVENNKSTLDDIKSNINSAEALVNLNNLINEKSTSKDEKLDLIKGLVENNKLTLDDIKSNINPAEALEKLNNLINEKSTSKDEKLEIIKTLLENNSAVLESLKLNNDAEYGIEHIEEVIRTNSIAKDEKLDTIKNLIENNLAAEEIKTSLSEVKDNINRYKTENTNKLEEVKNYTEKNYIALEAIKNFIDNQESLDKLEEIIIKHNTSRDEKLEAIKTLIDNNSGMLSKLQLNQESSSVIEQLEEIISKHSHSKDEKLEEIKELLTNLISSDENIKITLKNELIETSNRLDEIITKNSLSKDEKLEAIKDIVTANSKLLELLKPQEDAENSISHLEEILTLSSISKDEKLEAITNILENNSKLIDEIKSNTATEETVKNLEQIINQNSLSKDEKLDDLKSLVESYKNSIDDLYKNINSNIENTLTELSSTTNPSESLTNAKVISDIINSGTVDIKEILSKEVESIKIAIDTISEEISSLSTQDNTQDENQISLKLSELNNQLGEISQNYEHSLSILSSRLAEYIDSSEKLSVTTSSKLEDSVQEFEKIQTRFDELSGRLTTLVGNSGLIEILANIRQQFNVVIEELKKEREGAISDVKTSLEEVVSLINNNLYLVGQNIEAVYAKQIDNSANMISSLDSGLTTIRNDFNSTIQTVEETLTEKIRVLSENFEPLKVAITEFAEFDYANSFNNLKEKVELSYVNFSTEIKDALTSSTDVVDKVEETYKEAVEKLTQLETTVRDSINTNLENINNTLVSVHNISESNLDIAEDMQITFQADLLKLESNLQEERNQITSSITEGLQAIRNLIEKQKGLDAEEIRNAIIPLLENDELVDIIRGLNKSLADKINEFQQDTNLAAQDIVDIVNSISNTVNYTLDLIQDKFENSGKNAEKILEKIEELSKKFDGIKLDTTGENGEILDAISDLNYILNGISDNISSVGNILSSGNEFKSIIEKLDEISSGQNVSGHDMDIVEIKGNLEKLKKNSDLISQYDEALKTISSKIDVLAMSQNDDYTDIVEEGFDDIQNSLVNAQNAIFKEISNISNIKNDIDLILNNFKTYENNFEKATENILNKIDTITQSNNNQLTANIKSEIETLNNKVDDLAKSNNNHPTQEIKSEFETLNNKLDIIAQSDNDELVSEIEEMRNDFENSSRNIDCKLDEISQFTTVNEKLDNIQSNISMGHKLENQIQELNSKVDIIAMSETDDMVEEIYEIKSIVEEMLAASGDNSKVEESLRKLKDELSSLTNDIKFTEETEEIKDFVNQRTNELHHMLMDVKRQLTFMTSSSDDMENYTYTLQDVESDIAKLRLGINELVNNSDVNEITVISTNVNKMARALNDLRQAIMDAEMRRTVNGDINEEIESISSRLNKFLLSKHDFENELFSKFENTNSILAALDKKFSGKRIDKKLKELGDKLDYTTNMITILRNVMMYLGEWMDGTTETLSSIYDRCYLPDVVEEFKNNIPDSKNLTELIKTEYSQQEENIENLQNIIENTTAQSEIRAEELQNILESRLLTQEAKINKLENIIETKIEQQETRLDRIEKQLDKISRIIEFSDSNSTTLNRIEELDEKLTHLSANIEKLASYVE